MGGGRRCLPQLALCIFDLSKLSRPNCRHLWRLGSFSVDLQFIALSSAAGQVQQGWVAFRLGPSFTRAHQICHKPNHFCLCQLG
jgi:hypothetical protein